MSSWRLSGEADDEMPASLLACLLDEEEAYSTSEDESSHEFGTDYKACDPPALPRSAAVVSPATAGSRSPLPCSSLDSRPWKNEIDGERSPLPDSSRNSETLPTQVEDHDRMGETEQLYDVWLEPQQSLTIGDDSNPTPNSSSEVTWQPYTSTDKYYLEIDETLGISQKPDQEMVEFWDEIYQQAGVPTAATL